MADTSLVSLVETAARAWGTAGVLADTAVPPAGSRIHFAGVVRASRTARASSMPHRRIR